MANNNSNTQATELAELAMNRVLQAERDAERSVADCEAEAARILQAAQVRANRIAARTDERITRMQMRSAQQVRGEIKRLERAERKARQEQEQSYRIDETGLAECIEEIAVCMTGGMRAEAEPGDTGE